MIIKNSKSGILPWASKFLLRLISIVPQLSSGILTILLLGYSPCFGQALQKVPRSTYERAESFLPWNVSQLIKNIEPEPHWIEADSSSFWYKRETSNGWEYRLVNAITKQNHLAFDHKRLANNLGEVVVDFEHLDVTKITGSKKARQIELRTSKGSLVCELTTYQCRSMDPTILPNSYSPDGHWHLKWEQQKLSIHNNQSARSFPLVGAALASSTKPKIHWAPNGKTALIELYDRASIGTSPLLASVDEEGKPAPHLIPFLGGTRSLAQAPKNELFLLVSNEVPTEAPWQIIPIGLNASGWSSVIANGQTFWSGDGKRLFILLASRDGTQMGLWCIDPSSGLAKKVIEEKSELGLSWNLYWGGQPNVRIDKEGKRIFWFSEQDGMGHLWVHDINSDRAPRQLTKGNFVVRDLLWMSEDAKKMLITVAGINPSDDPYNRQLVSIDVPTGMLTSLSTAKLDHSITVSPSGKYYLDVASGFGTEVSMNLHSTDGSMHTVIEKSDLSELKATGWSWPIRERISLDEQTEDLFATILFPSNFDSLIQYPVIECLYPIPDGMWAPIRLSESLLNRFTQAQAIAELGFIVVFIDAPGSGLRSKKFRTGSRGHLHDVGLDERVQALKILAARHPQMDLDHLGVYGNSGGGNASVRALLARADVYHVAVASGGNHDLRFGGPWVERHQGLQHGSFEQESNAALVENLSGKLLLAHGALDRIVHPAQSLSLAQAFIEANLDVDVLLLPDRGHDVLNDPYFIRRMWDYFVVHLQNRRPPTYRISNAQE